ncbi:MAG: hypothetical protein QXE64_00095 [Candidatus Pacearchaeota archaeon]
MAFLHDWPNLVLAIALGTLLFALFDIQKYFYFLIPVAAFVLVSYFAKFLAARHFGFKIRTRLTSLQRFWFSDQYKSPFPIPVWLILPLLIAFLSYGTIKLMTFMGTLYKPEPKRLFRKFELDEFDMAKINISSIIACAFLVFLFHAFSLYDFAAVGAWFIVSNLIPLGSLDGSRIFYASWLTWTFLFVFCIIALALVHLTNVIISVILGLLVAVIVFVYFLYKYLAT